MAPISERIVPLLVCAAAGLLRLLLAPSIHSNEADRKVDMTERAWRPGDIVAYDTMRETAATVTAHLVQLTRSADPSRAAAAREEIAEVRAAVLRVNGFDRAAVDAQMDKLEARLAELTAS